MSWLPDLVRSFAGRPLAARDGDKPAPVAIEPEVAAEAAADAEPESDDPRDRRTETRHETAVVGRVRLPASEHDCSIIDLSTGGMNVLAPEAMVSVGNQVSVVTQNFPRLSGIVRWASEGMFGVQFAEPIDPEMIEDMGRKRRRVRLPRALRLRTEIPGMVYFDGHRHDVVIGNVSVGGMMLTARAVERGDKNPMRRGQPLMIEFAEMLPIGGHVRWTCGEKCGIMLSKPLTIPMAEEIRRIGNLSPAWVDEVRLAHGDIESH